MRELPQLMGILNVTPDSFSDGGEHSSPEAAVAHARRLLADGADLIDVGGCSTRPGSEPCSEAEELARVLPVVRRLAQETRATISVDTFRAGVAEPAIAAGAQMINCVRLPDASLLNVIRSASAVRLVVLGEAAWRHARESGIPAERLLVDPGVGFGDGSREDDLARVRSVTRLAQLAPVVLGVSRKRFVGAVCGEPEAKARDVGTHVCGVWAWQAGASILRVHDVRGAREALMMWRALCSAGLK